MGRILTRPRTPVAAQLRNGSRLPCGMVVLNHTHPRASDLICAYVLNGHAVKDLVTGIKATPAASTDVPTFRPGMGLDFTLPDNLVCDGVYQRSQSLSEYTFLARVNPSNIGSSHQMIFGSPGTGYLYFDIASGKFFSKDNGFSPNGILGTTTVTVGTWYDVAFTLGEDNARALYIDGREDATATPSGSGGTRQEEFRIGEYGSSALNYYGLVQYVYFFKKRLSVGEIKSFAARPYQIISAANDRAFLYSAAAPAGSIAPQHFHHRHHNRAG